MGAVFRSRGFFFAMSMSISTRRGDEGQTDLMFGRRVSKCDPRVDTYGLLDEVNAILGLARVDATEPFVGSSIAKIQKDLVLVMGELATHEDDWATYRDKGGGLVGESMLAELDELVRVLETDRGISFARWAVPGAAGSRSGAALDMARTVVRHAERAIVALAESGRLPNPMLLRWVNRLSDLFWLLARLEEEHAGAK